MIAMRKSIHGFRFHYMVMGLRLTVFRAAGAPLKISGAIHAMARLPAAFREWSPRSSDRTPESGPIHVTLDDDEQGDHDKTEIRDENCREFQHDDTS